MVYVDNILGVPLGYVLYGCWLLLGSYGWAIVLFTLATKVILLPLSVMAQRNAIIMVRLRPETEAIKRRFGNNSNLLLSEQKALNKREGYSSLKAMLPMLIQIPLVLGVIQVVYHPLRHLCHIGIGTISDLVRRTAEILDTTPDALGSAAQVRVIDSIATSRPEFTGIADESILDRIAAVDLNFLGGALNLGDVPSWSWPTIIWPFLAGLSALALSLYQNKYYVLQRFAGPASKWGITVFLVAFSFYFALILPGGFGLYWTAGNLLSIGVVWVCNRIDDPSEVIALAEADAAEHALTPAQQAEARAQAAALKARETSDIKRFTATPNKGLMVYAEAAGYWKYFAGPLTWLLGNTDVVVHYVTNDADDPTFERAAASDGQLRAYYVGPQAMTAFMMKLDVDLCIMTTPDLETYHIKRSLVRQDIEYAFVDHGMASVHLGFGEGALDHFDTIFANGPNERQEVRATEAVYGLPEKRIINSGYPLLDDMLAAVAQLDLTRAEGEPPVALVAPSWQTDNLLDLCLDETIQPLLDAGFKVIVRPHPEYVKRHPIKMDEIIARYAEPNEPNESAEADGAADADESAGRVEIQTGFSSSATVYTADVVITDWSTIAQEFSYATKKPSIFINTPMKITNPNYTKITPVPLEISMRERIGVALDVADLSRIGEVACDLIANKDQWRGEILDILDANIYNLGAAAQTIGGYVVASLARHQLAREVAQARLARIAGRLTPEQETLLAEDAARAREAQIAEVEAKAARLEVLATELRNRAAAARDRVA
jgi:YidC/Oxa1 family membrane protein insertase